MRTKLTRHSLSEKLPKWHLSTHAWNLIFFGQICHAWELSLVNFIHKVPLALSKCLSKWIKVDQWDYFQNGSHTFFSVLIYICFFEYETIVRNSPWSFAHSDPDPSSVWTERLVNWNFHNRGHINLLVHYILRRLFLRVGRFSNLFKKFHVTESLDDFLAWQLGPLFVHQCLANLVTTKQLLERTV